MSGCPDCVPLIVAGCPDRVPLNVAGSPDWVPLNVSGCPDRVALKVTGCPDQVPLKVTGCQDWDMGMRQAPHTGDEKLAMALNLKKTLYARCNSYELFNNKKLYTDIKPINCFVFTGAVRSKLGCNIKED